MGSASAVWLDPLERHGSDGAAIITRKVAGTVAAERGDVLCEKFEHRCDGIPLVILAMSDFLLKTQKLVGTCNAQQFR